MKTIKGKVLGGIEKYLQGIFPDPNLLSPDITNNKKDLSSIVLSSVGLNGTNNTDKTTAMQVNEGIESKTKSPYNPYKVLASQSGHISIRPLYYTGITIALIASLIFGMFTLPGCSNGTVTPPGPVQKIEIPSGFDKDYFEEICFSTEFGSKNHPIYRWVEDPKIYLINPPTKEKREICEKKMGELAKFTDYVLSPEIVDNINSANITVEWCELEDIPYQNVGSFNFYENNNIIYKAEILLFKDLSNILNEHNFIEEIGGCLGVTDDSYKYEDSIFYQGPCHTTSFTNEDLDIGNVLYQLNPGTTLSEFEEIFENSTKTYSFSNEF